MISIRIFVINIYYHFFSVTIHSLVCFHFFCALAENIYILPIFHLSLSLDFSPPLSLSLSFFLSLSSLPILYLFFLTLPSLSAFSLPSPSLYLPFSCSSPSPLFPHPLPLPFSSSSPSPLVFLYWRRREKEFVGV